MGAMTLPIPLDELPPALRRAAQALGLVHDGQLVPVGVCPLCFRPMTTACVRCGGMACATCDRCHGCRRVVCDACNADPLAPKFSFPGDRWQHPHSVDSSWTPSI
jgi:hypothetical protein